MKLEIILFLIALSNALTGMSTKMVTRNSERHVQFMPQLPEDKVFFCPYAKCSAWFYRQRGLITHCSRSHSAGASITLQKKIKKKSLIYGTATIQKAATQIEAPINTNFKQFLPGPTTTSLYQQFCEKQKKLYPIVWSLKNSPSALKDPIYPRKQIYKQKDFNQFPYECCLKLLKQHSYKKHVIEKHPELYNYNHYMLNKN